jgi:hypothetical protein
VQKKLCDSFEDLSWEGDSNDNAELLNSYIQTEIANNIAGDDNHSRRVREMIYKMLNK